MKLNARRSRTTTAEHRPTNQKKKKTVLKYHVKSKHEQSWANKLTNAVPAPLRPPHLNRPRNTWLRTFKSDRGQPAAGLRRWEEVAHTWSHADRCTQVPVATISSHWPANQRRTDLDAPDRTTTRLQSNAVGKYYPLFFIPSYVAASTGGPEDEGFLAVATAQQGKRLDKSTLSVAMDK